MTWLMAHFYGSLKEVQNMDQKKFFEVPSRVKSAKNGQKPILALILAFVNTVKIL